MEIKVVQTGKTLRSGQIVFEAEVSLAESGTFNTMEEREIFVKEKTELLNKMVEMKTEVPKKVEETEVSKKVKK